MPVMFRPVRIVDKRHVATLAGNAWVRGSFVFAHCVLHGCHRHGPGLCWKIELMTIAAGAVITKACVTARIVIDDLLVAGSVSAHDPHFRPVARKTGHSVCRYCGVGIPVRVGIRGVAFTTKVYRFDPERAGKIRIIVGVPVKRALPLLDDTAMAEGASSIGANCILGQVAARCRTRERHVTRRICMPGAHTQRDYEQPASKETRMGQSTMSRHGRSSFPCGNSIEPVEAKQPNVLIVVEKHPSETLVDRY